MKQNEFNHIKTSIDRLPSLLNVFLQNHMAVFVLSEPGLGKTETLTRLAVEWGADLEVMLAALYDRLDVSGLPTVIDDERGERVTVFAPLELFARLSKERNPNGKPIILYLNELNAAPESVLPAFYRLILERKVCNLTLRDNVYIVADGNPAWCASAGRDMQQALRRRFVWIVVEKNLEAWENWARDHGVDGRIITFLHTHPGLLSDFDPTKRARITYSSPASWTRLSVCLENILKLDSVDQQVAVTGVVGQEAGMQFWGTLKLMNALPDIDAILRKPENAKLPDDADKLSLLAGCVYNMVCENPKLRINALKLANRLLHDNRDFGAFLVRLMLKHKKIGVGLEREKEFIIFAKELQKDGGGLAEVISQAAAELSQLSIAA